MVAALAVVLTGAFASSASAAPCDPATFPTPFLRFYGGIYNANTRFVELHVRPGRNSGVNAWSDPVYPFTVTVAPSNGAARSFTVTNYARQQFPAKFTSRTQTTHVTATYDETHTTYPLLAPVFTTCTRTISATYKAPPKPRPTRRGSTGGGGRSNGGQSEDRDDV